MSPSPTRSSARAPLAVLAVGVAAVSTGSIFARLADAPPLALSFWRCAIAAALLLPFARRSLPAELPRAPRRELAGVLLAGGLLALHFGTWIASLELTSVASSVLLVNTGPVWSALLSRPLTGERVRPGTWVGVGLGLAGCLVLTAGDLRAGPDALRGDLLALAGGVAASLYFLLGRRLRSTLTITPYLFLCYGSAALALALACGVARQAPVGYTRATWGWILALALVPQLVGHSACNWAVRRVSATLVALSMAGEPVIAPILAWLVFAETPPPAGVVAGPAILAGVVLAARAERDAAGNEART